MKTLIIPDIHNNWKKVDKILSSHTYDKVVFIGDYFDDFNDTVEDSKNTAKWLKQALELKNSIFLHGNHDINYYFPMNPRLYCSGFEFAKSDAINTILTKEDWGKLKLFYHEQNFYISHAGIHSNIFSHPVHGITIEGMEKYCKQALEAAKQNIIHPATEAGRSRGGIQRFGGITWLDWSELEPIEGINQVVGHSYGTHVRGTHITNSENYCIDTSLKHIGWIEAGKFSFEEV